MNRPNQIDLFSHLATTATVYGCTRASNRKGIKNKSETDNVVREKTIKCLINFLFYFRSGRLLAKNKNTKNAPDLMFSSSPVSVFHSLSFSILMSLFLGEQCQTKRDHWKVFLFIKKWRTNRPVRLDREELCMTFFITQFPSIASPKTFGKCFAACDAWMWTRDWKWFLFDIFGSGAEPESKRRLVIS